MNKRRVKQIIYGAFFTSLWLVPLTLFLVSNRTAPSCFDDKRNQGEERVDCGGPCVPCLAQNVVQPQVLWENFFPVGDNKIVVGAKLRNPNLTVGASVFTYEFRVFGPFGILLGTAEGSSRFLPGETKYVIEGTLDFDPQEVSAARVVIRTIQWQPAELIEAEEFELTSIRSQAVDGGEFIEVVGHVVNKGFVAIPRVGVKAVLFDRIGLPLAVLRTEINSVEGGESRAFRMLIPAGHINVENVDYNAVDVEVEAIR